MNIASAIAFDTAEREYNDAWNAPSSTRFELPPVDVNKVLKERYRVSPGQTLTRAMIWDMETKKAWDPLTYIPYGNLEQYSLSAISALAERAVAALVPR